MVVMFLWCVQEVAGLKEEDLPSEDIDPPTAAGSSSTSVSHSTSQYMYTSCDSGTPLTTGIDDLVIVKKFLKSVVAWKKLGLELGLLYPHTAEDREEHFMRNMTV